MSKPNSDNGDAVWKALADPTRRTIIEYLREKPLTTGELCERLPQLTRYGVMKHLSVLEGADLVHIKRDGKFRWNIYNPDPMNKVIKPWVLKYVADMKQRFERFRKFVESKEEEE